MGQQRFVGGGLGVGRVGPVGEQRELRVRLGVGQRMQVQAVRQARRAGGAGQHGRHDDHDAVFGRDARSQRQARHLLGSRRFADQAVEDGHHRFGCRQQHQGGRERADPGGQVRVVPLQHPGHQRQCARGHDGQVCGQGDPAPGAPRPRCRAGVLTQRPRQRRPPGALQPVAGQRAGRGRGRRSRRSRCSRCSCCTRCAHQGAGADRAVHGVGSHGLHQAQQRARHGQFAAVAAACQFFDVVQRLVAGRGVFRGEQRRCQHEPHQRAAAGHQVGPVGVANGAQRGHGVAHAQVVGGLVRGLLALQALQPGPVRLQPGLHRRRQAGHGLRARAQAAVLQPLHHLHREGRAGAALHHQRMHLSQRRAGALRDAVAAQIGHLARGLLRGCAFGQAAQVFHQHHAQGGGQGPHLAQLQFAAFLVGNQVAQ
ncbi:MAG: hypothetical protein U5L05_03505 [Rubrivivax sp.]|nr:hypothetical protein [Rubrivivax sp.]